MNDPQVLPALLPALPEIMLALGAMALLMIGVFRGDQSTALINWLSIALLVLVGIVVLQLPEERLVTFGGSFVLDGFARFMKILALGGSAVTIILVSRYLQTERQQRFEYAVLILLSTLGMMVLSSASDLIALYLGLEIMSLALYVLAAIQRDSVKSTEAGLKYFVLGALSSGMLLYGASLIYGFTGTVDFGHCQGVFRGWGRPDLRTGVPVRGFLF